MSSLVFDMDNFRPIYHFQAPVGKFIQLTDMQVMVMVGGANSLIFSTRQVEGVTVMDRTESDMFFMIRTNTSALYSKNWNDPDTQPRMKYLSCGREDGTVFSANVIINYKLVNASIAEQVFEFIKRGKNP